MAKWSAPGPEELRLGRRPQPGERSPGSPAVAEQPEGRHQGAAGAGARIGKGCAKFPLTLANRLLRRLPPSVAAGLADVVVFAP